MNQWLGARATMACSARSPAFACVAIALGVSCGGETASPDAGADAAVGAVARFDPPAEGPIDWDDMPFPSDAMRAAGGTLALGALPSTAPVWESVRELLSARDGFCTTCAIFFPIDGALDPASVPTSAAPGESASAGDAIVMIDVELGTLVPLEVELYAARSMLVARPVRGLVLRRRATYAVALRSALRALDGSPLGASTTFEALRDGGSGDSRAERARPSVEPALAGLERAGVDRGSIVAVAAFTTGDPMEPALSLAEIVATAPAPVVSVDQVWRAGDGTLDALLGTPSEERSGVDVTPTTGTEGTRALAHSGIALLVKGSFETPRVVEGNGTEIGLPALERSPRPMERVPFLLAVPAAADPTSLPVALAHTGLGDTAQLMLALLDTFARAGIAMLAIDPFQQGERAVSAEDTTHWARGMDVLGPDGLFESTGASVVVHMFGVEDAGPDLTAHPGYLLGALMQQTSDDLAALRMIREGDLAALHAVAGLETLAFDVDHVFFVGGFQGAAVGVAVLAASSSVAAAVLAVPPGSWVEVLTESAIMRENAELVIMGPLGVRRTDEVAHRLRFDPLMELYRFVIEPIEPLALAYALLREPRVEGPRPDVLVTIGDQDEWVGPPTTEGFLAAAGIPIAGRASFAEVEEIGAPIVDDVITPGGPVTAAAWQYAAGHFFLLTTTDTRTVRPPIVPPFELVDPPETFDQPLAASHAQIVTFLQSRLTGRSRIEAP